MVDVPSSSDERGIAHLANIVLALNDLVSELSSSLGVTTTRGDLITRGADGNQRLAVGAVGKVLTSDGTDPVWGGGIATIESGSMPAAATLTLDNIPAHYKHLILQLTGISSDTATRHPLVQVDTDNGVSPDATAANYIGETDAGAPAAFGEASLINGLADGAASVTWTSTIYLWGYQGGPNMHFSSFTRSSAPAIFSTRGVYIGSVSVINALTVLWSGSGNFDAGTYALYGVI